MTAFKGIVKLVSCAAISALVLGGVSAEDTLSFTATLENGDIDASEVIDITDPILLVQFLYIGGPPPVVSQCQIIPSYAPDFAYIYGPTDLQNGDVNGDSLLDISDFSYLVAWLFAGGAPPVPFTCAAPSPSSS